MSSAVGEPTVREWPTIVSLAVLTAALTLVAGPAGTVAGVATALSWYALGTPYALAAGHVVLATAFPNGIDLAAFLLVELAFVVFVLASVLRATALDTGAVVLLSSGGLAGLAWVASQTQPLWIAAVIVLTVFILAAYTLHRYELVRLGLVPDDQTPDSQQAEP